MIALYVFFFFLGASRISFWASLKEELSIKKDVQIQFQFLYINMSETRLNVL